MPVAVIIHFHVKPDSLSAFRRLLDEVKASLPNVEACKNIQVFADLADPLAFTVVEHWESQAQHAAHVRRLVEDGSWAAIEAHLAAAPLSGYFDPI